jgi:sugar lactone lactonase YvrE
MVLLPSPAALAQSCTGTGTGGCQQVSCPNGGTTSVSGTVYAPDGTDALPNIFVYIPTTALTEFTDGVSPTNPILDDAATLVSGSPLVQTTTAANGTFTLTNVPPGSSIPIVIQAGRWRRQLVIASVASCQNTALTTVTQGGFNSLSGFGESTTVRFPQTQGEGDIPKMALVTGHADALECSLRKVGIADTEFTDYTVNVSSGGSGPGRVNLFQGSGDSGVSAPTTTHTEDTLVGSTSSTFSGSLLGNYNILMLPCQGDSNDYTTPDGRNNAIAFTGAGARIFATHHSAFYLDQDASIDGAANWSADSSLTSGPATINTAFTSGNILAEWLKDLGITPTQGQIAMTSLFHDQTGVISPTESWATLNSAPADVLQFSFYTPVGATTANQYGRVMFNEYHVDTSSSGSTVIFPAECTGTLAKNQAMTPQEHMLEYSLFDLMNFAVPVASTNLGIVITPSPTTFTGGDPADTITVEVTNNGAAAIATSPTVTLAVTLPSGLTPLTMTDPLGNWSCSVSTLTCTLLNPLAPTASNSVIVTVGVAANVSAGSAPISASVSSSGFVSSSTDNVPLEVETAPSGTVTGPVETNATSTNVGSTTTVAATVTFAISAGTTISSILVVTEGFTGKDFTNAGSGTCAAQTYGSAATCTVIVSFAPLYPGERIGAIQIIGTGNTLLDTAYISGIGNGPEANFQPGSQSVVASGGDFDAVVVDMQGDVYIVDAINNQVLKETLSSGIYSQSTALTGLNGPGGIAIDGAGNLYIANSNGDQVLKETLLNGSYTPSTVGSGLAVTNGVAVDGSGNVYIADSGNSRVLLETLSNGTYLQTTIATGFIPMRIAVDVSGNVYVSDANNSQVLLETLSSGTYTQSTVATGLNSLGGIAVDSNGTIYIADTDNSRILEEELVSGSYVQSVLVSGLGAPVGVALDELGNLYIADLGNGKVYRQDYSDPPSLSFASTNVNTVSSDSPQTVWLVNFGNLALTAVVPGIAAPTDFPQVTGNASDCTTSFSLAAAASCTLRIEFDPLSAGSKSESFVLTDNNLNTSPVTQTIAVSGTATVVTITVSPTTLTTPVIGTAYNVSLSASGGTGPYTFTVSSGSLPTGLSLSAGGVLSGTPTASGTFNFTVQAQDSTSVGSGGPYTGSRAYSLIVNIPTIVVAPSTLPNAKLGVPYSQTISASGGSGSYSYAVTGGVLPAGLSLNSSTGLLSGTPTIAGPSTFIITATDTVATGTGAPYTGSQSYSPMVVQIVLSPTILTTPVIGTAYNVTLSATGGTGPYTFTILSGSLPAGMSLSTTGLLSGTPTAVGSFTFTVQAQDSTSAGSGGPFTGNRSYSVTIAVPTIVVSPSTLPNAKVGVSYSQTISASGGSGSYSYAVTGGTLPAGLSLNSSSGLLSGTPTTAGGSTFIITATDTVATGTGAPYTGSQSYSPMVVQIVLSPTTLSTPVIGTAYNVTLTASGGTGPYTFTILSGSLPAGMSLSATGVLSGTPTGVGSFTFTVQAQDSTSAGSGGPYTGSRSYSVTIAAPTIVVAPNTLPNARVGVPYSQTISASGGSGSYSYAVTGGALPAGLSLNSSTGLLSGTPTTAGASTFIITATDTVATGTGAPFTGSQSYSPMVVQIVLSPTTLTTPVIGTAYNVTLSASGGTGPYTFTVLSGSLPAGMSLSAGGVLSGTPTAVGSFTFTIQAQDSSSGGSGGPYTGSQAYSGTIATPTIVVAPSTLPNPRVGVPYSQTISASGGSGSYSYAVTGGILPAGLSLNGVTGLLSGTPTTAGASTFIITATDTVATGRGAPFTGSQSYSPMVVQIVLSPASLSTPVIGTAYNLSLSASGGTGPYTFTLLSGSLPAGMSLSAAGLLSGTPTAVGSFTFTVQAQDSTGAGSGGPYAGSRSYSVTITGPTIVVSPSTLPNARVGVSYSQTISASGGSGSYSYAVTGGTLPAGLSLNSTTGALSGTPTTAGASTFIITATDTVATGTGAPYTGSHSYSLTVVQIVLPATVSTPVIDTAYNLTLTASGGTGPYTFTVLSGSLPAGLSLSAGGVLSGTPTAVGSFTFTVQAQDSTSAGSGGPYTGSQAYSVTIAAPVIVITPGTLASGTVGASYSQTISASGGSGSYSYAVTGGTLPAGLSLNSATGALTGTPTTAGALTLTIAATDTVTTGPAAPYTGSQSYSPTVNKAPTSVALATSGNPALTQSSVTFTATVSSTSGTPTGSVSFLDGTTPLGSGTVSTGVATFTTSSLATGSHSITAAYSGDTNFTTSSSSVLSQTVVNFGVEPVASGGGNGSSQTVSPGGTATYTIAITPTSGAVLPTITYLTVTGLPSGATATLATSGWTKLTSTSWSLPAFAQLSDVSLSFHVPASTASLTAPATPSRKLPPMLGAFLLLPFAVTLQGFGKRRRRAAFLLLLALSFAAITGMTGCGTNNGFYAKGNSTEDTNYTITVTVTTGALSHSTNVTLTVQ